MEERAMVIADNSTTTMQLTMEELMGEQEVTTKVLDEQIERLSMLRNRYQGMKTDTSVAHNEMKEQEDRVLKLLEIADKKSYKVDGLATVSRIDKLSVTTPKTNEDKKKFFDWINRTMGAEAVLAYSTVNSQTLNSLYNQKAEEAAERGESLDMDGIDMPTTRTTLSFRATNK